VILQPCEGDCIGAHADECSREIKKGNSADELLREAYQNFVELCEDRACKGIYIDQEELLEMPQETSRIL